MPRIPCAVCTAQANGIACRRLVELFGLRISVKVPNPKRKKTVPPRLLQHKRPLFFSITLPQPPSPLRRLVAPQGSWDQIAIRESKFYICNIHAICGLKTSTVGLNFFQSPTFFLFFSVLDLANFGMIGTERAKDACDFRCCLTIFVSLSSITGSMFPDSVASQYDSHFDCIFILFLWAAFSKRDAFFFACL